MPNTVFNAVVDELDNHLGDILALGMTKKAIGKVNATPDSVTAEEMTLVLNKFIKPALASFMSEDKARQLIWTIRKKINSTSGSGG